MKNSLSNVTIFAIGVENYNNTGHFNRLYGPSKDIEKLHGLLVDNEKTALYNDDQFIEIMNPTANILIEKINQYVYTRSAPGDVLLFYFSGHGVPIGRDDFGFCTVDTQVYQSNNKVLPLTLLKFHDLLYSLSIAEVVPVIIIDACYSGIAARTKMSFSENVTQMKETVQMRAASKYALLCACTEDQTATDDFSGGLFSHFLVETAAEGDKDNSNEFLGLKDIYPELEKRVRRYARDSSPQLFLGDTLPDFPLAINTQFTYTNFSFSPYMAQIVLACWNNGNEKELTPQQIREHCGYGAYGNHNKLTYPAWGLLEKIPGSRKRRLTDKGRAFVQGLLSIPKTLIKVSDTSEYVASPDTEQIKIDEFK